MAKPKSHCLAKALYDNLAESPDEIGFKRGDVLTVLEQNTNGLEGWWLCSLRGKQGIAPGNRLKLLAGLYEASNIYEVPPVQQDKTAAPADKWMRRSWDTQIDKVITPRKMGDVYIYEQSNSQDYDVPPSRYFPSEIYDSPQRINNNRKLQPDDVYDTPPSSRGRSPEVPLPSLAAKERVDSSLSETQDIYDIPPVHAQVTIVNAEHDVLPSNRSSTVSMLSSGSNTTVSSAVSSMSVPGSSNPPSICGSARSSSELSPQDIYDVPASCKAVVKDDVYDSPPPSKSRVSSDYVDDYDTPKSYVKGEMYDTPPAKKEIVEDDIYDHPPNNSLLSVSSKQKRLSPSPDRDGECVYDVPPQVSRDLGKSSSRNSLDNIDGNRLSSSSNDSRGSDIQCLFEELPMALQPAMDLLVRLQQDVQTSTSRLLCFVTSNWRKRENLEPRIYDIKLSCMGVKTSLQEFVDFAQGALANSTKAADKSLFHKLSKQLQPIQDSLQVISKSLMCLSDWHVSKLLEGASQPEEDYLGKVVNAVRLLPDGNRKLTSLIQGNGSLLFKRAKVDGTPNRGSTQDRPLPPTPGSANKPAVKPKPGLNTSNLGTPERPSSMQDRPLPVPPSKQRPLPGTPNQKSLTPTPSGGPKVERITPERDGKPRRLKSDSSDNILDTDDGTNDYANDASDIFEEYDYVELQEKDIDEQKKYKKELEKDRLELSDSQKERIEQLEKDIQTPVFSDVSSVQLPDKPTILELNDKQLLVFYSQQLEPHCQTLSTAIDNFFSTIEYNQPPKVFIAHSKYVVLAAHKLVFIGDTLHRNVLQADVRNKIMHCANYLCDCLKITVNTTKTAALQYPAVVAVQDMVDKVVGVSHAANELKLVINQAAAL